VNPPRLARALLARFTPERDRAALLADVDEIFSAREASPLRARAWYWRQALSAVALRARAGVPRVRVAPFGGVALDVKQAVRSLRRSPGFSVLAILSLGLGIGAGTALYGATRVVLLDTLPVRKPHELRLLYWAARADLPVTQYYSDGWGDPATKRTYRSNVSYPTLAAIREGDPERVMGFNFLTRLTLEAPSHPAYAASGLIVSGNAFEMLRIPMAAGRALAPSDDRAGAPSVVVLTYPFWARLGRDPQLVGRTVRVNGAPFVVAGVTGPAFRGLSTGSRTSPLADLVAPLSSQPLLWTSDGGPSLSASHVFWLKVMLRVDDAAGERERADGIRKRLIQSLVETGVVTDGESAQVDLVLRPGDRGVDHVGPRAALPMRILAAAVGVVILIACVNLAALLLARGMSRQHEVAVRQAIGAGRARVVRQLLLESFLLSLLGCAVGLLLAMGVRGAIASMLSTGFGIAAAGIPIDWKTLGLGAALATAAALASGLLPAVRLTSGRLMERLRLHMIGASAPRLTLARALLALQIAVSIPLVFSATLLLRSLQNLGGIDPGFDPAGLVIFRIDPVQALQQPRSAADGRPDPRALRDLLERTLERLEAIPGVQSATVVENPLLSGISSSNRAVIDGIERPMFMNGVGPDFFETFGIPLLAGRAPALPDVRGRPGIAVINQTAARRYFGEGSPIGRRFTLGGRELEVVGIAADTKYDSLRDDAPPTVFDSYMQRAAGRTMYIALRAGSTGAALEAAIQRAMSEVAPGAAIADLRTQADYIAALIGRERLLTTLLTLFGAFALLLMSVGLYGVTSYTVARRTSEIGLRVALGARRDQVMGMILRSVLALALAGLTAGLAASMWTGRLVESLLFGLDADDPLTIALTAAALLATSAASAFVPGLRATRIDPLTALRRE
jgi:predicted permease